VIGEGNFKGGCRWKMVVRFDILLGQKNGDNCKRGVKRLAVKLKMSCSASGDHLLKWLIDILWQSV